ncbi:MAG: PAS domain S-box protein [Bacteroidales bacterium]
MVNHESEQLKLQIHLFRQMADNNPDLLWIKDLERKYLFANRAMCDKLLIASDVNEPIGKTDMFFAERQRALFPDRDDYHTFGEICGDSDLVVLESGKPGRFDEYGNVKGKFLFLDVYKTPLYDDAGRIIGTVGCGRDVTQLQQSTKALADSENSYRSLFNYLSDAIYILDEDGYFVDVNDGAVRMYGYEKEEFRGRTPEFLSVPGRNDLQQTIGLIKMAYNGDPQSFEWWALRKNGDIFPKEVILTSGTYFGQKVVIATGRDITARKEAEKKLKDYSRGLQESNITKDKFFSIIAHDLKNPFHSIMGFADLLHLEYDNYSDEERKGFIMNIWEASENTYRLIQNLLEWSRTQTGRVDYNPQFQDLSIIANDTVLLMKMQSETKNIKLFSDIRFNTLAFFDENMVKTVMRNLISNAIKFSSSGGYVHIESANVTEEGIPFVKVTVTDKGTGIAPVNQEKLFRLDEKFVMVGTAGEKGTGLGLILCKELINKNKGKIWVVSQPGQGSSFSFLLPRFKSE